MLTLIFIANTVENQCRKQVKHLLGETCVLWIHYLRIVCDKHIAKNVHLLIVHGDKPSGKIQHNPVTFCKINYY